MTDDQARQLIVAVQQIARALDELKHEVSKVTQAINNRR